MDNNDRTTANNNDCGDDQPFTGAPDLLGLPQEYDFAAGYCYDEDEEEPTRHVDVHHSFTVNDDEEEPAVFRSLAVHGPSVGSHFGGNAFGDGPSALHSHQHALQGKSAPSPAALKFELPSADLPPLPPKPSEAEFAVRVARRQEAAISRPRDYLPPPVTCWTAFETQDADATIDGVLNFLESQDGTTYTRDAYAVCATSGDLRVVICTTIRNGTCVTMCRRLSGDVVIFNQLFQQLLGTIECKPTVCFTSTGPGCLHQAFLAAKQEHAHSPTSCV